MIVVEYRPAGDGKLCGIAQNCHCEAAGTFCTAAQKGYSRKLMIETGKRIRQLVVVLVEVTKYDSEGYLVQFYKGVLPCNTLAAMWSLTEAAFASSELAGLLCRVIAFDERTMRGGVNAL